MNDKEELQNSTRSIMIKLSLVCLLCVGFISGLVLIIQLFTQ